MENLRKRINVRLVNNEKDFLKYTSRPTYITHKSFGKNYAAIHEIKPVLVLKKPIYIGFAVLDLIKWKMYDFHYNFIKNNLMLNCYLLTPTVLLMKQNQKMFMKNFLSGKIYLTLVVIQKIQSFFDVANKKVIGKMKDKFGGVIVSEFVGLSSKMFLIKKLMVKNIIQQKE